MKFYIDFEATSPENEIIAIGAVCENGETFYSLVKPQFSCINQYISQLIHLSQKEVEQAETIDEVLKKFDMWVMEQDSNIITNRFISYGDDDQFLKATLPAIKDEHAFMTAAYLIAKMEDATKEVFTFFHGTISLIRAFNYIEEQEDEQRHNPLEDALMLQKVLEMIKVIPQPEIRPKKPNTIHEGSNNQTNYNTPKGRFFCKAKGKNATTHEFASCEDAIDWIINTRVRVEDRPNVHRARVMTNIMKSAKSNRQRMYQNFYWWRIKNPEPVAEEAITDGKCVCEAE